MIYVFDDFLEDPQSYRNAALGLEYKTYDFDNGVSFRGIASMPLVAGVAALLENTWPGLHPHLSFIRKSPEGQEEPHFIHTDVDMGEWSALLYLNPDPPAGDGTDFWKHNDSDALGSIVPHERSQDGKNAEGWTLDRHVSAKFNRLVLFYSWRFHSRAIPENWGDGDNSRLVQVTFGTGDLENAMHRRAA